MLNSPQHPRISSKPASEQTIRPFTISRFPIGNRRLSPSGVAVGIYTGQRSYVTDVEILTETDDPREDDSLEPREDEELETLKDKLDPCDDDKLDPRDDEVLDDVDDELLDDDDDELVDDDDDELLASGSQQI